MLTHQLYIILFLHQTPPWRELTKYLQSCISFFSYIKPQLLVKCVTLGYVVYHSFPTSNHNVSCEIFIKYLVVYHSFPTSNHNSGLSLKIPERLYIILFLHQTTTCWKCSAKGLLLYIILFLHQTTTHWLMIVSAHWLYIILFLHQTTTITTFPCASV